MDTFSLTMLLFFIECPCLWHNGRMKLFYLSFNRFDSYYPVNTCLLFHWCFLFSLSLKFVYLVCLACCPVHVSDIYHYWTCISCRTNSTLDSGIPAVGLIFSFTYPLWIGSNIEKTISTILNKLAYYEIYSSSINVCLISCDNR